MSTEQPPVADELTMSERATYKVVVGLLGSLLGLILAAVVYMVVVTPVSIPECLTADSGDCLWEKRNHGSEMADRDFIRFHGKTYYLEKLSR